MNRILRQAGIFIGLFLLVGLFRLPIADYEQRILSSIEDQGKSAGLSVKISKADLRLPMSLDLHGVAFDIPTQVLNIPIVLESVRINPKLLSLFLLRGDVTASGNSYDGELLSKVNYRLWSEQGKFEFSVKDLSLKKHPTVSKFGVDGKANVEADGDFSFGDKSNSNPVSTVNVNSSKLTMQIRDALYSGGHKIMGLLELPPAQDIKINVEAETRGPSVSISSLELLSSLGTVSGSGEISVTNSAQGISEIDAEMAIMLSDSGTKAFAAYLALAAGLPIDSPAKNWTISIRKSKKDRVPQTVIKAVS